MKYLLPASLVTFTFAAIGFAQNKTDAVNATKPKPAKTLKPFGIAPAGLTNPELKHAVERFDAASVLPGKPKPFTRMRWTSEDPPKLWYSFLNSHRIRTSRVTGKSLSYFEGKGTLRASICWMR